MEYHGCIKIGHRGACGYEPENTLRSFKKALALNVDMIELDVWTLSDGATVVFHDAKLQRTTNGKGYLLYNNITALKTLNAGKQEKIPTLQEALDVIDKKATVDIHVKDLLAVKPVADIIQMYIQEKGWTDGDFLVSSFQPQDLQEFFRLMPNVNRMLLLEKIPANYNTLIQDVQPYAIGIYKKLVTKTFVDDAHIKGLKVFVWTVNKKTEIKKIMLLQVDGIISDFPDRIN